MPVFLGAHNYISPLGYNSEENFLALVDGQSALQQHKFDFSENAFCCSKMEENDVNAKFLILGDPQYYTHLEKLCILSIQDVVQQSGIDLRDPQTLLIFSTTKGNIDLLENKTQTLPKERAYLHQFANSVGHFFTCKNTPLVVSNACISGLLAMIIAKRFIENGTYKNIIVCGGDVVSEFTLSGFKSFNALSTERCKPFDLNRNGINLGEAAASILLSSDKISNLIITAGASANDANHISGPSRTAEGLIRAISETLKAAGKNTVDFISAHGTATEYNDDMESIAFSKTGLNMISTNSLKGSYGHTLGAAGVLESIIAIQSLNENTLISSAGFETPGTAAPLNMITTTQKKELQSCLKTASGFGGCNTAAIFEKI